MSTLPFGISTHLYHDEPLSRDHLVEVAAHGFELVEVFANAPHFDASDTLAGASLREAARDSGVRVHSVHAPVADSLRSGVWSVPFSLATIDATARTRAMEAALAAVRLAHELEAGWVVVHLGVPDSRQPADGENRSDAARRSVDELQSAAGPLGVRLALEVMPNRLSTAERLVGLIEDDLDARDLGICMDVGHAHLLGDLLDAIETASGHVVTTHLHDNGGRSDDHLLPFDGTIDWNAAVMAFQKIGYEGALVLELAAAADPRQVLERARRVRQRLDGLFAL